MHHMAPKRYVLNLILTLPADTSNVVHTVQLASTRQLSAPLYCELQPKDASGLVLLTIDHSVMPAADGKREIATMCYVLSSNMNAPSIITPHWQLPPQSMTLHCRGQNLHDGTCMCHLA